MSGEIRYLSNYLYPLQILDVLTIVILISSIAFVIRRIFLSAANPISVSYRIAIIGLPRSGKTALVAALFSEIFMNGRSALNPVGSETINRVNKFIRMLDEWAPISPTKERDVFIFRFIYRLKSFGSLLKFRYEGEVVDFPGEMSEKMLDSANDGSLLDDVGIFSREFYSWIVSSRVIIFVVDVRPLLGGGRRSYVARMTSELRAAWQLLQDESENSVSPSKRRVALVFTKADLLQFSRIKEFDSARIDALAYKSPSLGFKNGKNPSFNTDEFQSERNAIIEDFYELIGYFSGKEKDFEFFFVSSYFKEQGHRFGYRELVDFILPKRN